MDIDSNDALDWELKPKAQPEEDDKSGDTLDPSLDEQRREARRVKAEEVRPVIVHLPDAIAVKDGVHVLLADIGDEVIFESVVGDRWNFTKQIVIKDIDDETGNVLGWDRMRSQYAGFNYKTNDKYGVVVKLLTLPLKKRRRTRRSQKL